ncbi:MAG: adenylyltransferase/cytidyltransferase family protein [Chlamydiia bacterium]
MAELKRAGKSIVTLNGSFDLAHAGHLEILSQAHDQKGDSGVLIVALNTDASIRRYKSPDRPLISLEHRLQMMAAYLFVDYVTWFEEDDPIALLKMIAPAIHVNGSEYGIDCIEADVVKQGGGKIFIVEKIEGLSSSALIQKIKATDI